jgi:hypothetical protein
MESSTKQLSAADNNAAVRLYGLDGNEVAVAQIPGAQIGVILTLDGRAFCWAPDHKAYVEVPTVVLTSCPPVPVGEVVH